MILIQHSSVKLPSIPPEPGFQPEHNNTKQSVVLQDAQIPQEAKDKISSLLDGDYNGTASKSPTDVGKQIFSKWTYQLQDHPFHTNHTQFH